MTWRNKITQSDALSYLRGLPDESVNCIVTSPPYYGLRDYGVGGQMGLEKSPDEFISNMVHLFREARRVLRSDGTLWLNMGDSYANNRGTGASPLMGDKQASNPGSHLGKKIVPHGYKHKDLMMMPHRLAIALQADGWWVRSDIVWSKPNPMPESVTDRPTKAHEYIFLLTKSARYFYDADAIREQNSPGSIERFGITDKGQTRTWNTDNNKRDDRTDGTKSNAAFRDHVPIGHNKRSVWTVATQPYKEAHFATFPQALIEPCVAAGCPLEVCAKCGSPVVRVTDNQVFETRPGTNSKYIDMTGKESGSRNKTRKLSVKKTTGFNPTCECSVATRPGIVLDMFMGSGTVAMVARRLGRDYTGCDLNQEYVAMATARLSNTDPLEDKTISDGVKQLSLFKEQS